MATKPFDTASIIRCFTTEHMAALVASDPQLRERLNTYEQQLQAEIRRTNGPSDSNDTESPTPVTPVIPIIPT